LNILAIDLGCATRDESVEAMGRRTIDEERYATDKGWTGITGSGGGINGVRGSI
jgi:hypothetical protein